MTQLANDKKGVAPSRKIVLFLSPSNLLTIIFLSLTALVLAYIAGVMSGRASGEDAAAGPVLSESPKLPAPANDDQKILAPEELEFARVLRGKAAGAPAPNAAKKEPDAESPPTEVLAADSDKEIADAPKPSGNAAITDYLFQMAAFRDENSADNLRQSLEGEGYRTILQKSGKMFVVLVKMRGTEQQAAELLELAHKMRLGDPVARERKPLGDR